MDGYDRIRELAQFSVGRACFFGLLAIITFMAGLIAWPDVAMRAGAILFLMTAAILTFKALQAPTRSYRYTELWMLLGKRHDLPEPRAQAIFGTVLRDTYVRYARMTMGAAMVLWLTELSLRLTGLAQP